MAHAFTFHACAAAACLLIKIIVLTETKLHSLIFIFERKFEQKF